MSAADDTTINGIIPGSGQCIIADCGHPTPTGRLMCHEHWRQVPDTEIAALAATWADWLDGDATLHDLRTAQRSCLETIR